MELQGKIIVALQPRSGTSARGEWKSQDFVLEIPGQYVKKMVFTVFGADRLQKFAIQVGQQVNVSFDIDAHEWNGRWFNEVRAYDVRPLPNSSVAPQEAQPTEQEQDPFGAAYDNSSTNSNLPY